MRQAGRYLPEFRELRERHGFWGLCRNPELAAEVTLQPLRRYGLDAAIVFSDIMAPLPAAGIDVQFAPGPVITSPVRTHEDVRRLRVPEPGTAAPFTTDAVRLVAEATVRPVIGFAGAPLTLAKYVVGEERFQDWLWQEPDRAHALLGLLAEVSAGHLRAQVEAGASMVQLFDSWAGGVDRRTYQEFGLPHARRALEGVGEAPRVYFATSAAHLAAEIATLPAETIGVDWRVPLSQARRDFPGRCLQGNLDPARLAGPSEGLAEAVREVLRAGRGGPHIFNLGHGVLPHTPPDNVARLVDAVHAFDDD
jgi:uroporphyrinogen decarboxylase